jgi:hypothetical protein
MTSFFSFATIYANAALGRPSNDDQKQLKASRRQVSNNRGVNLIESRLIQFSISMLTQYFYCISTLRIVAANSSATNFAT